MRWSLVAFPVTTRIELKANLHLRRHDIYGHVHLLVHQAAREVWQFADETTCECDRYVGEKCECERCACERCDV